FDVATNYSDVFSDFSDESTSDADADDEQSDWPDSCKPPFRSSTNQHGVGHHLLHPDINSTGGDAVLSGQVLKEVQEFLKDSSKKELFLDKVYRTSAIKQILRQEAVQVQIVKKGRVLGEAAPLYQFLSYDVATKRGSLLLKSEDFSLIWGALTIYGCHFEQKIALFKMLPFYLFVGILLAIILFLFVIGLSLPGRLPFVIEGKHAVITGGSKGIGRCIAEQLLEEGCKIVSIIARDLEALEKAKNEILQLGFEENSVKIYSCDLNSGQKIIKDLIEKIIADSGPIDLLINNAGTCIQNAFDELPEDAFEKQMKTNFFSSVYMTRAVLPQMKERRCGHISFVSSAAGQCAIWGYSAYSPSKFAVRAFADVLYMELLPYEIGVSVLFPPNTATEGFDEELKTMPEQRAAAIQSIAVLLNHRQKQQQQQKLTTTNYFKEEEEYIKKYSYYDNNLPAKKSILKGKNEEEILENEMNLNNNKINYSSRKSVGGTNVGGGGGEHRRQFSDDKNLLQKKELRWKGR
uniref:3-dehydrosphinganine reductase n=1 Tax=Meloidogyne floridensis TaxID=298350 RepID=A0A915NTZ2_9BILA